MITYLLKTILCSAFFLLFYKTVLAGSSYNIIENLHLQEEPHQVSTAVNDDAPSSSNDYDALYKEYLQIIEKYKSEKNGIVSMNFGISESDLSRMKEIFLSMTLEQQSTLPLIFQFRKLYEPKIITDAEFESWKVPSDYGIRIDGKRVDNSELNKYKPSDFSDYFKSRLLSNVKDYGKYVYHLSLRTSSNSPEQKDKKEADDNLHLIPNSEVKTNVDLYILP